MSYYTKNKSNFKYNDKNDYNSVTNEDSCDEDKYNNMKNNLEELESRDKTELLANIKMYSESMKQIEIMKDRLNLWKDHLTELNNNIGKDCIYIKEISIKVIEQKVEEIINDRKNTLNKLINRIDNFRNVMNTSVECMSNSISDFEKQIYNSSEDLKNNNKICRSYFQLSQRLKEIMNNINPYLNNKDLNLKEDSFSEINKLNEEYILREPIILIIDAKKMEHVFLNNNKSEFEKIIKNSITINSCLNNQPNINNKDYIRKELFNERFDKRKNQEKDECLDDITESIKELRNKRNKYKSKIRSNSKLKFRSKYKKKLESKSDNSSDFEKKSDSKYELYSNSELDYSDCEINPNSYSDTNSDFKFKSKAKFNSGKNSINELKLKRLIKDYSHLYAEYLISTNLSRLVGFFD